ncbi:MAG: uracil-DNA glycosylase [Legionellales bacterium]|nr:uracil-DNA glycosylase [Legionellales bacterium]|tara:strand:+ start:396 stop:1100 length:705 start_codon:yes stop_codon:yes gene_type:complete
MRTPGVDSSWLEQIGEEFDKPYMKALRAFLQSEKKAGKTLYPPSKDIFNALNFTPFEKVKVIILGQDPYHGPNQAHGLCFSVQPTVRPPPSLVNIYKELASDCNVRPPGHGSLIQWTTQGVLLLNSVLTVEKAQAASHQGKGWETFTDAIIERLNAEREHCVFILWGSYAQKKGRVIDESKHCVIRSVHPSPLSAHRGFFGSRPFSQANAYLLKTGQQPIDWQITSDCAQLLTK